MSTLLLFIDGIGIGADAPDNPFAGREVVHLAPLAGRPPSPGGSVRALDATLGVPGLPQSATGQTTLFTGTNAARALGRHHPGLPGPTLQAMLREGSLFSKLVAAGARPTFANAFTRRYLEARRVRYGATTHMVRASGVPLRVLDDGHESVTHDVTGAWMEQRGVAVPRRTVPEAARVLAGMLDGHDLVLFEYFLTDLAAHRGTVEQRLEQARRVEALVAAALAAVDLARHRVAVVSDHGNLEESGHTRHTSNPVALLAWGLGADRLSARVDRMDTLTPALVEGV